MSITHILMVSLLGMSVVGVMSTFNGASTKIEGTQEHTHVLTVEASPIGKPATDNNPVWDLSQHSTPGLPAAVIISYGDSLLSEAVLGVRRWYSLRPDSCALVSEESRYRYLKTDTTVLTVAVARDITVAHKPVTESCYRAKGMHTLTFPMVRTGRYVSDPPVAGRLVVAEGDTLRAFMTREWTAYAERVYPDTLGTLPAAEADTLAYTTETRWRWYTHGNVPVAVQTRVSGNGGKDETRAFIMDYSEASPFLCEDEENRGDREGPREPFANADARWRDGHVDVELDAPAPVDIDFEMVSDTGMSQCHTTIAAEGHTEVSVDCRHPMPGRYVVVLSTPSFTRKIFLMVK